MDWKWGEAGGNVAETVGSPACAAASGPSAHRDGVEGSAGPWGEARAADARSGGPDNTSRCSESHKGQPVGHGHARGFPLRVKRVVNPNSDSMTEQWFPSTSGDRGIETQGSRAPEGRQGEPPRLNTKAWLTRTDTLQGQAGADRHPSTTFDGWLPRRLTGRHAHLEKLLFLSDPMACERLARQHTCLCCTDSVPSYAVGPGGSALLYAAGKLPLGSCPRGRHPPPQWAPSALQGPRSPGPPVHTVVRTPAEAGLLGAASPAASLSPTSVRGSLEPRAGGPHCPNQSHWKQPI